MSTNKLSPELENEMKSLFDKMQGNPDFALDCKNESIQKACEQAGPELSDEMKKLIEETHMNEQVRGAVSDSGELNERVSKSFADLASRVRALFGG